MLDNAPRRPRLPGPGFCMSRKPPVLGDFRRIVVKVGSSLLVDAGAGRLDQAWLASLAADIATLHGKRRDVLVVSSGAIALGRSLNKLLEWRAVPVINENDTVATNEIRYGDNDRLAARVATMVSADLLVLLSDVDGLYDSPPAENPDAKRIPQVAKITAQIEAMAGTAGSDLSRGGMQTKIEAGKIATAAGAHMVIAPGAVDNPLQAIAAGGPCTWFLAPGNPVTARKKWIAGSLEPKGNLFIDSGAVAALRSGKSLLPAGVKRIEGEFARGDAVVIRDLGGQEIARGLSAYDAADAAKILGKSSADIALILG